MRHAVDGLGCCNHTPRIMRNVRIAPSMLVLAMLTLLTLVTAGCAQPPSFGTTDLVGHWTGDRMENGALIRWLVHNKADGSIHIRFTTCFAGRSVGQSEHHGVAMIEDGEYRTTISSVVEDGTPHDLKGGLELQYNYDVLELTGERMVYRFIGNPPTVYTVTRVDADHALGCPPASQVVDTAARGRRGVDGWIRRGTGDAEEDTPDPAVGDGDGADRNPATASHADDDGS